MKKLILLLAFIYLTKTNAQTWVNIPDANFASYLQGLVPSAMSGTSLNITSTLVTVGTQTIIVQNLGISNLNGVQYFTSLTVLYCDYNFLTSLPILPNSLQILYCEQNSLTSLPTLPNSLKYLDCHINSLNNLPALPNTLQHLSCSNNSITSLPTLPNSLQYLDCSLNSLSNLPVLPPSLVNFYCYNNNISCFPTFPNSIAVIGINVNPYNCLPNYVLPAMNSYSNTPLCGPGNTNGCLFFVTGFEEFSANNYQIKLYPNPAKEMLNIELDPSTPLRVTDNKIQLQNALGHTLIDEKVVNQHSSFNIQQLKSGMYFLKVLQGDKVVTIKKIVKE